jgi:2-amino-4-hydroxy-6-hydroxymethyldihydropteridine diphosphokinase
VLQLQTIEKPEDLLRKILEIEIELGRKREIKWGERTIDIDILFYNHDIINIPGLIIPHPYLHERRFTLVPLHELAPDFIHPLLNKSIKTLLAECKDPLEVK